MRKQRQFGYNLGANRGKFGVDIGVGNKAVVQICEECRFEEERRAQQEAGWGQFARWVWRWSMRAGAQKVVVTK